MDIQRIVNTPGIRAVHYRLSEAEPVIEASGDDAIDHRLFEVTLRMLACANTDNISVIMPASPFDVRLYASRHGAASVVVAVDVGHPITKSLPRLVRRAMKARGSAAPREGVAHG